MSRESPKQNWATKVYGLPSAVGHGLADSRCGTPPSFVKNGLTAGATLQRTISTGTARPKSCDRAYCFRTSSMWHRSAGLVIAVPLGFHKSSGSPGAVLGNRRGPLCFWKVSIGNTFAHLSKSTFGCNVVAMAGGSIPGSLGGASPPGPQPSRAILSNKNAARNFMYSTERPRSMARGCTSIHAAGLHRESIASHGSASTGRSHQMVVQSAGPVTHRTLAIRFLLAIRHNTSTQNAKSGAAFAAPLRKKLASRLVAHAPLLVRRERLHINPADHMARKQPGRHTSRHSAFVQRIPGSRISAFPYSTNHRTLCSDLGTTAPLRMPRLRSLPKQASHT